MKSFILSAVIAVFATTAVADSNRAILVAPTPQTSQGGDGAAVLLLLLGAVILMNGGLNGGERAKAPSANIDTDDSVLMRF